MKKVLTILLVLFAVVAVGLAVFIATFDADRYRPLLVQKLQEALKRPVTLQRLSLGWRQGIAVRLQGLTIPDTAPGAEPLLQVDSADAVVKLLPLLQKDVQVSAVVLSKPRVHVVRDAQGQINLLGLAAAAAPAGAARPSPSSHAPGDAVSVAVSALRLEDGSLHWSDAMTQPATDLWLKHVQVSARHIAPGRPMDVDVSGALGAEATNFKFTGRLTLPGPGTAGSVEDLKLALSGLPLESIVAQAAGEPQLHGKLTLNVQGAVPSLAPEALLASASGSGRVALAEPVVTNFNLLREVFGRLSVLPGLVQALESRLPPEYQEKLTARDTILAPIDLNAQLEQGALRFDAFQVRTDAFGLTGSGRAGLDGTMAINAMLQIDPTMSEAIFRSVKELRALANSAGELELPLVIQGQAPHVAVLPDVKYVASRVAVTAAVDALSRFLQRKEGASEESVQPDATAAPAEPQPPSTGDLLGSVLQRVLQPKGGSGTSSQ